MPLRLFPYDLNDYSRVSSFYRLVGSRVCGYLCLVEGGLW